MGALQLHRHRRARGVPRARPRGRVERGRPHPALPRQRRSAREAARGARGAARRDSAGCQRCRRSSAGPWAWSATTGCASSRAFPTRTPTRWISPISGSTCRRRWWCSTTCAIRRCLIRHVRVAEGDDLGAALPRSRRRAGRDRAPAARAAAAGARPRAAAGADGRAPQHHARGVPRDGEAREGVHRGRATSSRWCSRSSSGSRCRSTRSRSTGICG